MTDKMYIFHSKTATGNCDKCRELDDKIFYNKADIPQLPLHPNCHCWIEEKIKDEEIFCQVCEDFAKNEQSIMGKLKANTAVDLLSHFYNGNW